MVSRPIKKRTWPTYLIPIIQFGHKQIGGGGGKGFEMEEQDQNEDLKRWKNN